MPEKGEWYSVRYWIKHFELDADWKSLMLKYKQFIILYPDVKEVFSILKKKYKLILITNASRDRIEVKLEVLGLNDSFDHTFSATTDFVRSKAGANVFAKVAKILGLKPEEILHVGDHQDFDYEKPKSIGMNAILLDRSGKKTGPDIIHNLNELPGKIK